MGGRAIIGLRFAAMSRRLALTASMVTCVVLAAGCSSGGDDAAVATTELPAVVVEPTTSSLASSSTVAESTTTSTAAPTWTPEELEVIAAYEAYQTAFEQATAEPERAGELLGQVAVGDFVASNEDYLRQLDADGLALRGEREFEIVAISFLDDEHAELVDCGLDGFEIVDREGEVVEAASIERRSVSVFFIWMEGRWLADGRLTGSSC